MVILLAGCVSASLPGASLPLEGEESTFDGVVEPAPGWVPREWVAAQEVGATGEGASVEGVAPTVVIGGGVAGLAAAAELPPPVIVLEADTALGGRARWAGGFLLLAGTPELEAEGLSFTADAVLSDWETLTGGPPTEATARFLADTPAVRDRLADLGLTFALGHQDPVLHTYLKHRVEGGGQALIDALVAGLPEGVEVRLGVPATGLRIEGGRVVGVETGGAVLPARAVVVASGGFVQRSDLLARFTALPEDLWGPSTDPGGWGAAMGWARDNGLGVAEPGAVGWNADLLAIPDASGAPMTLGVGGGPPWVWVDGAGRRFVDESARWSLTLAAELARRGDVWAVFAWDELRASLDAHALVTLDRGRTEGRVRCGGDPARLALTLGLPPEALWSTLDDTARSRDDGAFDAFGRPTATLPSLAGELCAARPARIAAKNYGGLATDGWGRVLDRDGQVVPGLYAAGEAGGMGAPGLGGPFGFDGSLSAVVWSGWMAGEVARLDLERPPGPADP